MPHTRSSQGFTLAELQRLEALRIPVLDWTPGC
jgi:hypothetical protein